MTIQLANQIVLAERDLRPALEDIDGRFTPAAGIPREWSARLIRVIAARSLSLADRLDPGYSHA
jgi:hypothetical protein